MQPTNKEKKNKPKMKKGVKGEKNKMYMVKLVLRKITVIYVLKSWCGTIFDCVSLLYRVSLLKWEWKSDAVTCELYIV